MIIPSGPSAQTAFAYCVRQYFYKKMGFGYGTKTSQYRVRPAALPKGPSRAHVRYLDRSDDDKRAVLDCYNRFLDRTHGMIEKSAVKDKPICTTPF